MSQEGSKPRGGWPREDEIGTVIPEPFPGEGNRASRMVRVRNLQGSDSPA